MVAKVPIRTVYTGANATGLSEYQTGEFIDYVVGGTGLIALGSANQVLATNSGATAMEWQAPTTGDITGVTAGNGLSGGGTSGTVTVTIDTSVTADLSTAQTLTNKTLSGGTVSATQVDVTAQGDLRLQDTTGGQYVALQAPGTVSTTYTVTMPGAVGSSGQALRTSDGSGTLEWFTLEIGDITNVIAGTGMTGGGTSGAVTLDVIGGTGITANANDIAIDSTVATLTGTQILTNKTFTSPVLNGTLSGTAFLDEDNMVSDSAVAVASQQSIKAYVDATASGLDIKESSHAATTANLSSAYDNGSSGVGATLTNNSTQAALTVDGQLMVAAERLLVKDQTSGLQNGIYTVTTVGNGSTNWVLTRATDFDSTAEVTSGAFTFVETGTTNADSGWVVTTDGTITIGTTAIAWSQFSGAGQITAGTGLTKTGNTLDVDAAQTQITSVGTIGTGTWQGTAVADGYLGTGINANKLADGTVTNAELQYINSLSSNAQTQITNVKTTADAAATKAFAIAQAVALG